MLNTIWVSLIAIGILFATGSDIHDELSNRYRNGVPLGAALEVTKSPSPIRTAWEGDFVIPAESFNSFYGGVFAHGPLRQHVIISMNAAGIPYGVMDLAADSPEPWRSMAAAAETRGKLSARLVSVDFSVDKSNAVVRFVIEPIRLVKLKAVTNAAIDYAGIAVNISLGLIGVMALWLGIVKVAEEAGLLKSLMRVLAPLTRRLFPEVPADHPAMGAMVMNIAANMLGLSNAATPLGLKAMEELNRLNPRAGTATNAMVTFLAINTGGLIIIPATAIAVRAAAGSANPGIIIGTSLVGAGCATIAGVTAARLLERLPRYRNTPEEKHG
jgi:spore maturation protein A